MEQTLQDEINAGREEDEQSNLVQVPDIRREFCGSTVLSDNA